jgi:hypothetical protein
MCCTLNDHAASIPTIIAPSLHEAARGEVSPTAAPTRATTRDESGHTLAPMALIHTCYRITDIDRSIAFYSALGFEEVGRIPIRDEAINVFMNQPGDGDMPRLELTYNFGVDSYEIGTDANLDLYSLAQAADGTWRPTRGAMSGERPAWH